MQSVQPTGPGRFSVRRPTRAAFFMGSDITTHMVMNRVIPILINSGVSVVLFTTRAKTSRRRPRALRQLFYVEHTLLQEHAFPYVNEHGTPRPDGFNTPEGWQAIAPEHVTVRHVDKVNDPEFVAALPAMGIDVTFSVRCYQKFKQPILEALGGKDNESLFVNLHPGLLPWYRGVNTFLRAMQRGERNAGFTLHHMEADWDTGDIIGQARFPLSYSRSVLENMMTHTSDAAGLIVDLIGRVAGERAVPAEGQDHDSASYFSYPEDVELDEMFRRGIDVFRASSAVDLLTDTFFGTVPDTADLRQTLIEALIEAGVPYDGEQSAPDAPATRQASEEADVAAAADVPDVPDVPPTPDTVRSAEAPAASVSGGS